MIWKLRLLLSLCARTFCLVLCLSLINSAPVLSQESRSSSLIRFIVPYAAGGPADIIARMLVPQLQNVLKQTIIVENRVGAGSVIGARMVAGAVPDGNTILIGNLATFAIAPATMKNPGYDPTKSFAPIIQISDIGAVMVTHPNFPANTIQEFVAYARANPGKLSYASAGIGHSAHLLVELLRARAQLEVVHVPYRSGSEMSVAVMSGQVQFANTDLSASISQIREGKLKVLAVTGATRSRELPDVPTMIESGYPDIVLSNWTGAAAPAGTPAASVKKLQSAISDVVKSPEFQGAIKKIGGEGKTGTSEEFATLIATEYKKWGEVAKAAGVSLD